MGVAAAALGLLLISVFTYLELRYTENGTFIRQWATKGAPNCRFDDCVEFMAKWLRIHQFVESPLASLFVGMLVGGLCRRRYSLPLLLGVTPIMAINYPSDVFTAISAFVCIVVAWLGARLVQLIFKRFSASRQTATAT